MISLAFKELEILINDFAKSNKYGWSLYNSKYV